MASLVALAQAATHAPAGVRLAVVLSGSVDVTGSEPLHPAKAMLHGFMRSLAAEHPELGCRIVDVGPHVPDAALADQLRRTDVFDAIALRGTGAWRRIEEPFEATRSLGALRHRGVYVLTGGFGGLGRVVARGLAATGLAPRLVLVGRTVPDAGDAFLAELEQLGAEVRVVPADVSDARAARRVLDVAAAHYGVVNGVLHLAGIPGDGMIAFRSPDDTAAVLAPKVGGTLALAEACAGRAPLDFFVMFSSRSAVDGLIGSADYAAANAFQDATAVVLSRQGVPALSIGWPSWAEVGMAVDRDERLEPWVVEVGPDTPLLDEHRIDGVPVMPGTGHLDLAVRALRERVPGADGAAVELRDVLYEQVMAAHGRRRIEVRFTPAGAGWEFEIWSRSAGPAGPAVTETAVRHVRGRAALLDVSEPPVDVEALLARFPTVDPDADAETVRLFTLGPRWDTVTATRVGTTEGEKLVELQLPAEFTHEAEQHVLHPTLLDSATASARNSTESPHLPFLIERLVVHADLPARVVSHIRRRRAADGLISADVDLLARDGRVLAQLGGYTMRQVGDSGFLGGDGGSTSALDDPEFGVPPLTGVGLLLDLLPLAGEVDNVVVRPFRSGRPVPLEAAPSSMRPPAPVVEPVAQLRGAAGSAAPACRGHPGAHRAGRGRRRGTADGDLGGGDREQQDRGGRGLLRARWQLADRRRVDVDRAPGVRRRAEHRGPVRLPDHRQPGQGHRRAVAELAVTATVPDVHRRGPQLAGGWHLWPQAVLRGAGLPVEWMLGLAGSAGDVGALLDHPEFAAAITWQNPAAARSWVTANLDPGQRKLSGYRRAVLGRYAQRYCTKNDTIGFFGSVGWAELEPTAAEPVHVEGSRRCPPRAGVPRALGGRGPGRALGRGGGARAARPGTAQSGGHLGGWHREAPGPARAAPVNRRPGRPRRARRPPRRCGAGPGAPRGGHLAGRAWPAAARFPAARVGPPRAVAARGARGGARCAGTSRVPGPAGPPRRRCRRAR